MIKLALIQGCEVKGTIKYLLPGVDQTSHQARLVRLDDSLADPRAAVGVRLAVLKAVVLSLVLSEFCRTATASNDTSPVLKRGLAGLHKRWGCLVSQT